MPKSSPLIARISVPAVLSAVLALLYIFRRDVRPAWAAPPYASYLLAAFAAASGVVLLRFASYLLLDLWFRRRKGREAPQLLRMVVSMTGYALIFVLIYSGVMDKSLSGILTTSAVLTVILGLALQDTLGNFFAGISLHVEQPYHIGDALQVGEVVGRVESVTWRTTTVRTTRNSQVIFPNSRIARDPIEVFALDALNRRSLRFLAPYDAPPEKVIQLARQIAADIPRVATEMPPIARIAEFADSGVAFELLYWIKDYLWAHEIEAAIRERLWYAFRRHGIEIPFPTRHVLMETTQRSRASGQQDLAFATLLSQIDLWKALNPHEVEVVAGSAVHQLYAPGEFVLRTGDAGDSMFVVHHGQAEVLGSDAGGNSIRVAVLEPGGVFGEMGLFTGEPRKADVRALTELGVLEIRKPVIQKLLAENVSLVESFSRIMGGRLAELSQAAETAASEERSSPQETILRRIKRFFTLAGD
jgi:small-conductance mechanosensitive channel/CRP-like cAMP-binding protein